MVLRLGKVQVALQLDKLMVLTDEVAPADVVSAGAGEVTAMNEKNKLKRLY